MGTDFEEYTNLRFLKLEDSIKDGLWSRKKKSNKKLEKKFHRVKFTVGHRSRLNRTRKKEWKRNNESKGEYINFHEDILEDEIHKSEIQTRKKESEMEENHKSKCDCICFHRGRIYDELRENILEGEASFFHHIYANKIGVVDESYTTGGPLSFDMPEELLFEVLSRLPLKSLARFKCVSKQWQLMILNNVPMKNAPKLLILSHSKNNISSFHSLDITKESHLRDVYNPIEELLLRDHKVKAHSSCHGLILIQIDDDLFVWNPLTKFFRKVFYKGNLDYLNILADLCFDSSNDEYKVLVQRSYSFNPNWEYFIGTCNTSTWEMISVPETIKNVSKGPFFRGYRHYICKGHPPTSNEFDNNSFIPPPRSIVYFDPSTYKFIEIPTPQPKNDDHNFLRDTFIGLGVIDECLCITRWFRSWGGNIEFLVMKEYGNGNSWSVMFVLSNLPVFFCYGAIEPLFRTKEGDVLLSMSMCYRRAGFKAYDVDRNFLKDILSWTKNASLDVVSYEESCDNCERFFPDNFDFESHESTLNSDYSWYHYSNRPWDINGQVSRLSHGYRWDYYYSDWSWDIKGGESTDFDLLENDPFGEEQYLREKKWSRNKKAKKSRCTKIPTKRCRKNPRWRVINKIQRSKKKRKGNKTKLKSKCGYVDIHDITLKTRDILRCTKNGSYDVVLYEESSYDCEQYSPSYCDLDSRWSDCLYPCSDFWFDTDDGEYTDFDLLEIGDFVEDEFLSWEKKWSRNMKTKKSHCIKIATKRRRENSCWRALNKIQRKEKKTKGNKTKCKAKCGYINIHDITLETKLCRLNNEMSDDGVTEET